MGKVHISFRSGELKLTANHKKYTKQKQIHFVDRNQSGGQKTTEVPQVTDKLYHIKLYQVHLSMSDIRTDNLSVLDTALCDNDCQ